MSDFYVKEVLVTRYIVVNSEGVRVSSWLQTRKGAESYANQLAAYTAETNQD